MFPERSTSERCWVIGVDGGGTTGDSYIVPEENPQPSRRRGEVSTAIASVNSIWGDCATSFRTFRGAGNKAKSSSIVVVMHKSGGSNVRKRRRVSILTNS